MEPSSVEKKIISGGTIYKKIINYNAREISSNPLFGNDLLPTYVAHAEPKYTHSSAAVSSSSFLNFVRTLQSQSPNRDVKENGEEQNCKARLFDYAHLGPDDLKKDLEECQDLVLDPANIELDTPPDFWLSQLDDAKKLDKVAKNGYSIAPWCFSD
ncbi:putative NAC domain-containing protein 8 [Forsythia ovata]|uniref:NAC domain-containing protein 8 n=1 Tax=Forsythia ovata TaxID=205694 RepID=A0ABD1U6G7_9LAMI